MSKAKYWSQPSDVHTDIDRIRYIDRSSALDHGFVVFGFPATAAGPLGIYAVGTESNRIGKSPTAIAVLIGWAEMNEMEYCRRGETQWRPCAIDLST